MEEKICIKEVNENIRNVRMDLPLTRPLKQLNQFCEFKKEWENRFNLINDEKIKSEVKKRMREYNQKPEVKKRRREYNQRLEVKKRMREYMKEYNQKPEVKKRKMEYMKEYDQKPEVKKRKREYMKEYQRKKLKIPKSRWRVKVKCKSIKGRRKNCKHFCLDGKIEIKK